MDITDNDNLDLSEEEFELEIVDDADTEPSTSAGAKANDEDNSEADTSTDADVEETEADADDSDPQDTGDEEGGTEETLNDDEKEKYGKRAQKRIRRLVAEKKALEEKLAAIESRASEAEEKALSIESRASQAEEKLIEAHDQRLKALRITYKKALKEARDIGDFEAEQEAFSNLSKVEQDERVLEQYKATRARELESRKTADTARTKDADTRPTNDTAQTSAKPSPEIVKWQKRNTWFGGQAQGDKVKTAAALAIHETLLEEGYDPRVDEQEYLAALDSRLHKEFPDLRKKPQAGSQKTAGAARGPASDGSKKSVVKLTKSDLAFCERMGIDPKKYAIEKMQIQRGS